jgi:hypothetical protein
MTEQKLKDYINVVTGRARVKHASKPLTEEEKVVNRLVVRARACRADMSPQQRHAWVLRGC